MFFFFFLSFFTPIVKDSVQFVMAASYKGFSSRRQHQTVRLSAFVAAGGRADQPGERLVCTASLPSSPSLSAHLSVINGLQSDR